MSHMLDLMLWFIGDVESLDVVHLDNLIKSRHIDGQEVQAHAEDFGLVAGTGVEGTKFVVQSDMTSPIYQNYIEIVGTDGYVNLSIIDSRESYIFLNHDRPPYARGKNPLQAKQTDLFELMFADLIQQIQGNGSLPKNNFADAAKLARLLHEIEIKGRE
jgi:predicted dehydrogenase